MLCEVVLKKPATVLDRVPAPVSDGHEFILKVYH